MLPPPFIGIDAQPGQGRRSAVRCETSSDYKPIFDIHTYTANRKHVPYCGPVLLDSLIDHSVEFNTNYLQVNPEQFDW